LTGAAAVCMTGAMSDMPKHFEPIEPALPEPSGRGNVHLHEERNRLLSGLVLTAGAGLLIALPFALQAGADFNGVGWTARASVAGGFHIAAGDLYLVANSGLTIGNYYNHSVRMFVQASTGNVGVGTTNPQYLLSVKGTVGAQEFIVTNTGWSDYVFQPGYRLRPLREIGAYIRANHHLPDIPSEAEVKAKGVSVGEMQSKLLAKVEELTLHMIQADERNNRLEEQNQELRDRLARLEKVASSITTTAAK